MLIMTVVLLLPLAACTREEVNPGNKIDETKTQLRISNYQGGFGRVWLDNAAERFEEKYKNESFEPGKTGVEIHITSSINDTAGSTFLNGLPNNPNHIIFTENVSYDAVLAGNYAADITDIVKEQKPDIALLHLSYLDHQKHLHGPLASDVPHAVDFIDNLLGSVFEALSSDYIIFITGDHAHRAQKGSVDISIEGISVHPTGQSAEIYLDGISERFSNSSGMIQSSIEISPSSSS